MADIEQEFGHEVRAAVDALTNRDGESYLEFLERAAANPIARKVKIVDIEDNMNLTRLDSVDDSVLEKQATYHEAWRTLRQGELCEHTSN